MERLLGAMFLDRVTQGDHAMKRISKMAAATLLCASIGFGLQACEQKGPAEKASEKIDRAAEKAGKKIDDAADKAGEKLDKAADRTKDGLQEAGEKLDEAGKKLETPLANP